MRERTLHVALVAFALAACDTRPLPPPPEPAASASASPAAPVRSAPFVPLTAVIPSATASASAAPVVSAMPGIPDLERTCTTDADCDKTFLDIQCCADCMPRIGNATSVKKIAAFCKEHKPASCPKPPPCGMVFGSPRCNGGKCISR